MAGSGGSGANPMWKHQADAELIQANPISGTKYTVLDTVKNARIISMSVKCTWTVQPTPLELHVTIDGQAIIFTKTDPATNTYYDARKDSGLTMTTQPLSAAGAIAPYTAFLLEGKSVKVEAEITGGTVSELKSRIQYAKKV